MMSTSTSSHSSNSSRTSTGGISSSRGEDSSVDHTSEVGKGKKADKPNKNIPEIRSCFSSTKSETHKTQQAEWQSHLDQMHDNLSKIDAYCDAVAELINKVDQFLLKGTVTTPGDSESSSDNDSSTESIDRDLLPNISSEDADDDSGINKHNNVLDSERHDNSKVNVSVKSFKENISKMRREGQVIITEANGRFDKAEKLTVALEAALKNNKIPKDIINKGLKEINSIFNSKNEIKLSSSSPEVRHRSSPSSLISTQENKDNISAPKRHQSVLDKLINENGGNNKMVDKKPESVSEENGNTKGKQTTDGLDSVEKLLLELMEVDENNVSGIGSKDNSSSDKIP